LRKAKSREAIDTAKKSLAEIQSKLNDEEWHPKTPEMEATKPVSVGDTVYLRENNLRGTVLSISEKSNEIEILAGHVKLKVGLNSVEKVAGGAKAASRQINKETMPGLKAVPPQLDLRGKRADEVEVALDSYLNDAALSNLNEVLIIHGIATGTVLRIARDFLAAHPLVKSFRSGNKGEGGEGTTVVRL